MRGPLLAPKRPDNPHDRALEGTTQFEHSVRHLFDPADPSPQKRSSSPIPLFVALHGQGMSATSFRRVCRHLPTTGHGSLFPEGPYRFEMRDGTTIREGHGWYIYLGDSDQFRDELNRSEAHLLTVLDQVERNHGPFDQRRSIVLGFSQGGYLAGYVALRHPDRFGGVVISSARLKHEFLTEELRTGALPAVLILHSPEDSSTAYDRAVEGRDLLEAAGADVELHSHSGGHRLPAEALEKVAEWARERDLLR